MKGITRLTINMTRTIDVKKTREFNSVTLRSPWVPMKNYMFMKDEQHASTAFEKFDRVVRVHCFNVYINS